MKKYLAILLGAVFILGFAASAFAIHAEIPAETQAVIAKGGTQITIGGEIRFRQDFQNNTADFNTDNHDSKSYYDARIRLSVEAKVTPNTTGFVQIEAGSDVDGGNSSDLYVWGNNNHGVSPGSGAGASNAAGIYNAGDAKRGTFSVLQAWILHTGSGLGMPAGIKVGHMPLALGNSLFFDHTKFGDDAIVLFADPTKELHIALLTAKFREGSLTLNDDADAYVGLFAYKTKEFGLSGDVTYVDDQLGLGTQTAKEPIHFWNFGLRGDVNAGGLTVKADAEVQAGKVDVADVKFRGYAGLVGLSYKLAPVTLVLEGAYGSGDDTKDGKMKAFVTSESAIQHFTYVYDYRTKNACGQQYGGLCNTMYLKAGVTAPLAKDLAGELNLYWLQAAKKSVGAPELGGEAATSRNIGTELDARITYKIDRNLTYWVEGGYLFAGDFMRALASPAIPAGHGVDDAYTVRQGIQLSF